MLSKYSFQEGKHSWMKQCQSFWFLWFRKSRGRKEISWTLFTEVCNFLKTPTVKVINLWVIYSCKSDLPIYDNIYL